MPIRASQAWAEASASNSRDPLLLTLELYHSSFTEGPIYVVDNTENLAFTIEDGADHNAGASVTFQAIPFTFDPPRIGTGGGAEATVTVDNIGREISKYLPDATELNEPVIVRMRGFLASRPSEVGWGPYRGEANIVTVNDTQAQMTVNLADPQNRRFGRKVYTLTGFPALQAVS